MKKLLLIVSLLIMTFVASAQKTWFVGGTAGIGYDDYFYFALEPQFGYEFTARWAIGTGIGMALASSEYTAVIGVAEPYVRFNAWNNDKVFVDLKATAGFGFTDVLVNCQVGIVPSLRFRINEHWDMAADLGLFGAKYDRESWSPAFGINSFGVGLWFAYRF